ncbi:MAG: cyclic nucleotide-binding domain-containing protein [Gammaproteobacteria bacterium]|nr:cyclic nucleotide-binding domain-containing protein [Gammaproteobacteria bacterium]
MDTTDRAGTQLGKYHIIRRLGISPIADVLLARDPFIDREVALKVSLVTADDQGAEAAAQRAWFFNDAQTAGALRHPNITTIFDAGIEEHRYYIAMEFVPGEHSLEDYVVAERLLPLTETTRVLTQCALALDYAHRRGVIHQNIKPSNVLVSELLQVKITDFGGAISKSTPAGAPRAAAGCSPYQAPEQFRDGPANAQTDLYSLGVVAYQLLTGKQPFLTQSADLRQHNAPQRPPPLADFRVEVPDIYQRIIEKLLAKNPGHRYKSGADLAGDLSLVFDFLPENPTWVSPQKKFAAVSKLDFFQSFAEEDLWEIVHAAEWQTSAQGDQIITEGDLDTYFFVLVEGSVAVQKNALEIVQLHAGECFGEMGLVSGRRRSANIVALTAVTLLKIGSSLIERMSLITQNRFQRSFLRALIARLHSATERLVHPPKHS